jgi:hypothetical protein
MYPFVVAALMKIDERFARAADCTVESNADVRLVSDCEVYALPALLANAAFLTLGVLSVAFTAEMIIGGAAAFWLTGIFATAALLPDADLFSFVMTESLTFGLYSIASLAFAWALTIPAAGRFFVAGALLGLVVLTRTGYFVLLVIVPILIVFAKPHGPVKAIRYALGYFVACVIVLSPWTVRNALSTGHWGLTEEYGSATLIERFAFNDMTAREFFLSFPYCLPAFGQPIVEASFGKLAMDRFVYYTPKSFFHVGRGVRDKLIETHGRLDPLIAEIVGREMKTNWWRHLLISLSLGWCGMWVGGIVGLFLVPALFLGLLRLQDRKVRRLLLLYAAPAFAMLGLHALIANQYTRYNLILIGPFAIGAALLVLTALARQRGVSSP